jgi:hypothetical protein
MENADNFAPWRVLYQYWLDKHVDGRPPGRKDLDPPIEIPRLAKDLMLVEVCPDGLRYRVVGSAIANYMTIDVTGRLVAESGWTSDGVRASWRKELETVRGSGKPLLLVTRLPATLKAYNYCLVLPLLGIEGKTEHLLIGVFYGGFIDQGTEIQGLTAHDLTAHDLTLEGDPANRKRSAQ